MRSAARRIDGVTRRLPPSAYSGSPTTGWPTGLRCTRIWCVRPVSSRRRSRSTWAYRATTSAYGDRMAPACLHRHPLAVGGTARDRRVDRHPVVRRMSPREGRVAPLHPPLLDRAGQAPVRLHRSWRPPAARRCPCRAGARSRGVRPPPPGDSAVPRVRQRVHERVVPVPRRRMHDESGRLVDHRQVVVLVHEREIAMRRGVRAGCCRREGTTPNDGGARQLHGRAQRAPIGGNAPVGDEAGGDGAGERTAGRRGSGRGVRSAATATEKRDRRRRSRRRPPEPPSRGPGLDLRARATARGRSRRTVTAVSATLNVGQRTDADADVQEVHDAAGCAAGRSGCRRRRHRPAASAYKRSAIAPRCRPHHRCRAPRARRSPGRRRSSASIAPRHSPNAAPGLYTRRSCTKSPITETGRRRDSTRLGDAAW